MIYIENLDFGYQKKREVFSGLNLSLTGGHIYGLLGKNGAGKTTLLKLIGGLLFPLRGRIEVCDAIPRLRKPSFLSDIFFIPEGIEYTLQKSFWAIWVITKKVSTQPIHPILINNSVSDCSHFTSITLSNVEIFVLSLKLQLDNKHEKITIKKNCFCIGLHTIKRRVEKL